MTAAFVLNCLGVLNRELGADFDLDAFSYVPFWDPHTERMDLRLRAEMPQRVTIPGADLSFDLACGEEIRVEISTKFRLDGIRAELAAAGFTAEHSRTDRDGDFALTAARRNKPDHSERRLRGRDSIDPRRRRSRGEARRSRRVSRSPRASSAAPSLTRQNSNVSSSTSRWAADPPTGPGRAGPRSAP